MTKSIKFFISNFKNFLLSNNWIHYIDKLRDRNDAFEDVWFIINIIKILLQNWAMNKRMDI